MTAQEHDSMTWKSRLAMLVLVAALLVGGAGEPGADAARNRKSLRNVQEFSNPATILIKDNSTSAPSTIEVSGLGAPITEIAVTLNFFSHSHPVDVDMLLVGPGGQTAMIMSDVAAGTGPVADKMLVLRDSAERQLPSQDPVTSGTFQPTNYEYTNNPDSFAPHPRIPNPLPSGAALSAFNGADANGVWTLFVDDGADNSPDSIGAIGRGWSLRITTANGAPQTTPDQFEVQAGKAFSVPAAGVLENDRDPDDEALTATLAGSPTKGTVDLQPDGSFTYRSTKKAKGTDSFTYLAQDTSGLTALETVTIEIKGKGKGKHKKKRGRH